MRGTGRCERGTSFLTRTRKPDSYPRGIFGQAQSRDRAGQHQALQALRFSLGHLCGIKPCLLPPPSPFQRHLLLFLLPWKGPITLLFITPSFASCLHEDQKGIEER